MISLNGVTLSEDLLWTNEFDYRAISQQDDTTVLGRRIISTLPIQGGREIILSSVRSGNRFTGYYTRTQIQEIKSLEKNGTTVVFIYESQTFNVIIKSGSVKVTPIIARPNQEDEDWYTGSITLLEV